VAAWVAGAHRTAVVDGGPAFVTTLAPVHTEGYEIVVPDIGSVVAQHGLARLLGEGKLTLTVRSVRNDDLIVAALVPAADAARYTTGTARTDVVAVGYAMGAQPVEALDRVGREPSGLPPWEAPQPPAGHSVTLGLTVPTTNATALVVRRWDDASDFTVAITAGFAPGAWGLAISLLLIGGTLALLTGLAMLLVRGPSPDELHAEARSAAAAELSTVRPAPPASADEHGSPYVHTAT
jgi:hypothetical protein